MPFTRRGAIIASIRMHVQRIPLVWRLLAVALAIAIIFAVRLTGGGTSAGQAALVAALLIGLGARAMLLRSSRR